MERIRRNERMSAMMKILTDAPNRIFTLSTFCELFGAAKSTMSQDIAILQEVTREFGLGQLETVTGAAGGVRYRTVCRPQDTLGFISGLCESLSGTERLLPGGFIYYSDILSDPQITRRMGQIIATAYYETAPDFVLTMETKGIPVAMMTAHALSVPLVIARRSARASEGPAVNINYVSGAMHIDTMSLSRRAVQPGTRALIVDDFLRGGGTAKGMTDLMAEFGATVAGMAFVMEAADPEKKRVSGQKSLMIMDAGKEEGSPALIRPAPWIVREGRKAAK